MVSRGEGTASSIVALMPPLTWRLSLLLAFSYSSSAPGLERYQRGVKEVSSDNMKEGVLYFEGGVQQ